MITRRALLKSAAAGGLFAGSSGLPLPRDYDRYFRIWFILGWPAFLAMVAIFWLMIARPQSF